MTTALQEAPPRIETQEQFERACNELVAVKHAWDKAEAKRKMLKRPSLDSCKVIDDEAKQTLKPLIERERKLRQLVEQYVLDDQTRFLNETLEGKEDSLEVRRGALQLYAPPKSKDVFFTTAYKVAIKDRDVIPTKYIKTVYDTKAMIQDHRNGEEIPGAHFYIEIQSNVRKEPEDEEQNDPR